MQKNHLDKDDRLEQHYRRLGTRDLQCVACSESDLRCLEMHHLAGRKHHDDTAPVCRNCHRKLSDDQLDHALSYQAEPSGQLADIGRYLLGLCDLLMLIIETMREFGHRLVSEAQGTAIAS